MINIVNSLIPFLTGLWTLPWILIGYFLNIILSKIFGYTKIDFIMKKIGLFILFILIPLLLFRIFLDVDFSKNEVNFFLICISNISIMYIITFFYAKIFSKKMTLKGEIKNSFIKTLLTNQGRSSAFVGGAMLAIPKWQIPAAIYMSIGAIFLFAVIPQILFYMDKKEKKHNKSSEIQALPWYLKLFPWYLLLFAIISIITHSSTSLYLSDLGDAGILFKFITALTIPAALYYVGSGIHPSDLKKSEIKKLFNIKYKKYLNKWLWVRHIFFLIIFLIPIFTIIIFSIFKYFNLISNEWFAVIIINSFLPITSTNMFLIPYGLNKRVTALSISWSTILCVPIVIFLITYFNAYF
jgi:hypothetical protein